MIDILGPDPGRSRICAAQVAASQGIHFDVRSDREMFVFELAVPLKQNGADGFSVERGKASLLGIEFETVVPEMPPMHRPGGGFGKPYEGGMQGPDGRHSPGAGGGGRPPVPEPVRIRTTVVLTDAPSDQ